REDALRPRSLLPAPGRRAAGSGRQQHPQHLSGSAGEGGEHHLWSFHLQPTRHPVRDERGVLLHPCAAEPVTSDVLTPRDGTVISYYVALVFSKEGGLGL